MRKFVCAAVVTLVTFGVAMAEEFAGIITKVEDGKVTFFKFDFKAKEKGEETTLPAATDIKVVKGKFNKEDMKIDAGDKIENGLKNEMFKKIEKGMFAFMVTDKDGKSITEIRVLAKKKKDAE